ncbi:hypothetical protein OMCYN_01887 [cyanobiont of Ornithocercus magnificus]|nr:hypothetical protein OMCYN_01887 [cyanobiont of Ornithocercus magnificus]
MIRLLHLAILFYLGYWLISRFWAVKDMTEVIDVEVIAKELLDKEDSKNSVVP